MLILKIMSNEDLADSDPAKEFRLVADVLKVRFYHDLTSKYERSVMGWDEEDEELKASFATATVLDLSSLGGSREETHFLSGNCYILNDRGKTVETFWAQRRSPIEPAKTP